VPRRDRIWVDACLIFGCWWLWWCSSRGMDYTTASLLLVGECALASHWWPRYRKPYPEVVRPRGESRETIPQAWTRYVSSPRGIYKGVPLTDHEVNKFTEQWTVSLPRDGGTTVDEGYGKLPKLAHALNRRLEDLIWEPHPGTPSAAILQIVTNSPIKKTVYFKGPRVSTDKDGTTRIDLGPYADGLGYATWRIYSQDSMWGGFLLGGIGAGKSRAIELIAIAARSMGNTVIFYCDGQNGSSSSALDEHVTWSVEAADFGLMLTAIEAAADARQKLLKHDRHRNGFTPSPEFPGILVVLDEMHKLMDNRINAARLSNLARETRKVGISFIGLSQYSGLDTFGGSGPGEPLRSSMLQGNGLAFKVASRMAGQLMPGLTLDPSKLPKLAGYAYTVAAEEGQGRTAPFRMEYIPSGEEKVKKQLEQDDVDAWLRRYPEPELDAFTASALGDTFINREEIARQQRETLGQEIATGRYTPSGSTAVLDRPRTAAPSSGGMFPKVPFLGDPPSSKSNEVGIEIPSDLTDASKDVYLAIAKGFFTPKDIATSTGYSVKWVGNQLATMIEEGVIHKEGAAAAVTYKLGAPPEGDEPLS
jgi:hypothetical protein